MNYIPAARNGGRFRSPRYSFTPCSQNQQHTRSTQRELRGVGVAAHSGRCGVKYTPWPKRDLVKNYFQLPNEIFLLGLLPGAQRVTSRCSSQTKPCQKRAAYVRHPVSSAPPKVAGEPGGRKMGRIKAWRLVAPRRITPARSAGREDGKREYLTEYRHFFSAFVQLVM